MKKTILLVATIVIAVITTGCQTTASGANMDQQQLMINEMDAKIKKMDTQLSILQKEVKVLRSEVNKFNQSVRKVQGAYVDGSTQEGN